ncbi:MAG: hypothetical protein CFE45_23425, partial [Burkholderiales bacterium PBB5]
MTKPPVRPPVCTAQRRARRWLPRTTAALALTAGTAWAQLCGPLPSGGYGPYDYRTDKDKLALVEKFHFTAPVQALVSGATGKIGGDLEYTLDKFPNHHRALLAVMQLAERHNATRLEAMTYPVDCYFDRALRFRRDDTVVRGLFALHLSKTGRREQALAELETARGMAGENALTHANLGLVYTELQDYPNALLQAQRARELGFAATVLVNRLKAAGQWREAPAPDMPESG